MTARARVALAAALAVLALAAGVAGWDTPHVTGWTFAAFLLAMSALWTASPLLDGEHPDVEVRRVTLDEACRRVRG